jgi:hypothetical protein
MLTAIFTFLGLVLAALGLFDFFASEATKRSLENRVVRTWNTLDDIKSLADKEFAAHTQLRASRVHLYISAWSAGAVVLTLMVGDSKGVPPVLLASFAIGALFAITWTVPRISQKFRLANTRAQFALRGLWLFVRLIIVLVVLISVYALVDLIFEIYPFLLLICAFLGHAVVIVISLGYWFHAALESVIIRAMKLSLWLVELVFRRIAESPKGSLFGLSALFAALAATAKILLGK